MTHSAFRSTLPIYNIVQWSYNDRRTQQDIISVNILSTTAVTVTQLVRQ